MFVNSYTIIKDLLRSSRVRYVIFRYFILSNVDEIFPFQPLKSIDGIPLLLSFKGAGHVYFYERIGELPGTDSVIESRIMNTHGRFIVQLCL